MGNSTNLYREDPTSRTCGSCTSHVVIKRLRNPISRTIILVKNFTCEKFMSDLQVIRTHTIFLKTCKCLGVEICG